MEDTVREPSSAPRVLRIDSRRRIVPDVRELREYLHLAVLLGRRDITTRYRQTALGTVWIFAGALVTAGLFSFVFGRVADLPSDGYPYYVFSYSGLLAWNLYAAAVTSVSSSLNPNSSLISKIYFPRLVLPISTLASTMLNTFLSTLIMLGLLVGFGIDFTWQLLLLPVWLLLGATVAMGIGLFLVSFSVMYRDVGYFTPVLTSILLYLSPVAYSLASVPKNLRTVYLLNPLASIIEGTRWSALGSDRLPPTWGIVYSVAFALVFLVVGASVFSYRESHFADVI